MGKDKEEKAKVLTKEPDYEEHVDESALEDIESLVGGFVGASDGGGEEEEPGPARRQEEPQGGSEYEEVEEDPEEEDDSDEHEEESEEAYSLDEDPPEGKAAEESSEIAHLKQQVQEMKELLQGKQAEEKEKPLTIPEKDFLKEIDVDEVYEGKEGLNKLSNNIFKEAVAYVRELYLKDAPELIRKHSPETSREIVRAELFFRDNADIAQLDRSYVAGVAQKLAKKYPDMSSDKLFEVLPKVIRKDLKMKPGQERKPKRRANAPRPTGTRKESPKRSEVERDIDAIMEVTPIV